LLNKEGKKIVTQLVILGILFPCKCYIYKAALQFLRIVYHYAWQGTVHRNMSKWLIPYVFLFCLQIYNFFVMTTKTGVELVDPIREERAGKVREVGSQAIWSLSSCKPGIFEI
jgi:hypothetical protein